MEPIVQWILALFSGFIMLASGLMANWLRGINSNLEKLNLKVELFMQSAESRFENIEHKQEVDHKRLRSLEEKFEPKA